MKTTISLGKDIMTGNFQAIAADLKVGSEELKTEL